MTRVSDSDLHKDGRVWLQSFMATSSKPFNVVTITIFTTRKKTIHRVSVTFSKKEDDGKETMFRCLGAVLPDKQWRLSLSRFRGLWPEIKTPSSA